MGAGGKIVPHDLACGDDKSKPTEVGISAHERHLLIQWFLRFKPLRSFCVELFLGRHDGRRRIDGRGGGWSLKVVQFCQFWYMRPNLFEPPCNLVFVEHTRSRGKCHEI